MLSYQNIVDFFGIISKTNLLSLQLFFFIIIIIIIQNSMLVGIDMSMPANNTILAKSYNCIFRPENECQSKKCNQCQANYQQTKFLKSVMSL